MNGENPIHTFAINLKRREDRKAHIQEQFYGKSEFELVIKDAIEHRTGALGLWLTIADIIEKFQEQDDFLLICEDDHQFTDCYSAEKLYQSIEEARQQDADILLGGVSWLNSGLAVSDNLFWVQDFSGLQFAVIFRRFFTTILETAFENGDAADYKISQLAKRKFFIYPFISTQKEFGYSDVTGKNNKSGHVNDLFCRSDACVQLLKKVSAFYNYDPADAGKDIDPVCCEEMCISTFVLNNRPGDEEHLRKIERTFHDKSEFDITILDILPHSNLNLQKWAAIKTAVELATHNDDDLLILCEDDHLFTENYSRDILLKNILEGHIQGAAYISGGAAGFNHAVQVATNRFWIDPCFYSSFFIIYKSLFQRILQEPISGEISPERVLSGMSSNKMVIYPFISTANRSVPSPVTGLLDYSAMAANTSFWRAGQRLAEIYTVNKRYHAHKPKLSVRMGQQDEEISGRSSSTISL